MGLLHLCDSLLTNLSKATQGQAIAAKPERKFRDIFTNMESWQPMGINKTARPDIPAQYMPALSPDRVLEVVEEPHLAAIWSELDANWTQALVSRYWHFFWSTVGNPNCPSVFHFFSGAKKLHAR